MFVSSIYNTGLYCNLNLPPLRTYHKYSIATKQICIPVQNTVHHNRPGCPLGCSLLLSTLLLSCASPETVLISQSTTWHFAVISYIATYFFAQLIIAQLVLAFASYIFQLRHRFRRPTSTVSVIQTYQHSQQNGNQSSEDSTDDSGYWSSITISLVIRFRNRRSGGRVGSCWLSQEIIFGARDYRCSGC